MDPSLIDRILGNVEAIIFQYTGGSMKGWRTMAIALGFVAVGAALIIFAGEAEIGGTLIASGLTMAGMRTVTNTKLGEPK